MKHSFSKIGLVSLIIFLSASVAGLAQMPEIPIPKFQYDTTYIDKFDNLLAIRFVVPRRTFNFRLKNQINNAKVIYRPNLQAALGLGFTYRWLAFDIVVNPKFNKRKTEKFGKTDEFNIKGTVYLKKHMIHGMFRVYTGMHITNPEDYLEPWDGQYPYRQDIKNMNINLSYTIPLNYDKYAPRTTFLLDGRMKKSAGSFISTSAIGMSTVSADSSIIPMEYDYAFDPEANIRSLRLAVLQQYFGYAYTFIHNKYFLTISALPGLSYTFGNVYSDGGTYQTSSLDFVLESKNSIGYNSRKWYAGVYFTYKYLNIQLKENLAFNNSLGEIRFFVGYRINAPYVVNKLVPK